MKPIIMTPQVAIIALGASQVQKKLPVVHFLTVICRWFPDLTTQTMSFQLRCLT